MRKMIEKLRRNFIAGSLLILPSVVTIFVLWWLFTRLVSPLVNLFIKPLVLHFAPDIFEEVLGPGVSLFIWDFISFLILILFVVILGTIARNIIGGRLIKLAERFLSRIPIVSKIYTSAQQIGQAFLGEKKGGFRRVVLFEYPRKGIYSLGLVSGPTKGEIQKKTQEALISVFIPTTPNPTSGLMVMVPEKDVVALEMSVEEALKFLISGGKVTPALKNGH